MADGTVTIAFDGDTKGLEKDIDNVGSNFNRLKSIATKALGAIGFGTLVKEGVQYNATVEQLQTSFEVMTGSATKATDIVEKLKEIGAKTPFEFTGLAETTQLLMNYGFEAEDAIDKMQMLGDISQGSADKMNRIATAYGQMSSAGKVSLEDVKQMIEAGFNPLQEISQSTGESMASLYDRISKGTISIDEITASMERSTSVGGKYFQSMEKQSQTLNGQWSTLKDNFSNILGSILKPLNELLTNNILPAVNEFIGKLQEKIENGGLEDFVNTLKNMLNIIVPLTAAFVAYKAVMAISGIITTVTTALNGMTIAQYALNLAMSLNPIGLVVAAIAALVAGIVYLWNTNEGFRNAIIGIWNAIKEAFETAINAIVGFFTETIPNAWNNFILMLQNFANTIWNTLVNAWNSIVSFFTETIPSWIQNIITWFQQLPYNIGLLIGQIIGHIIQFGTNIWNWVTTELPKIIQGIIDWFAALPGNIWSWLTQVITNIVNWGKEIIEKTKTAVSTMFNNVINWFKQLPGNIWNWLVQTVNKIVQWGVDMKNKAKTAMSNMVNSIINTVKSLPGKMLEIGKNIVQGIWNGISGAVGWLWNKITSFCNGIVDGIKQTLGIHSPSKVLADEVGNNMALGIGKGFIDELKTVYNKMQNAVNVESQKLSANLTNQQIMKTELEDNRQATLQSIDDNKEIVVNSTTKLDSKVIARETNKVNARRQLQYSY